jgi:hypothetical protein
MRKKFIILLLLLIFPVNAGIFEDAQTVQSKVMDFMDQAVVVKGSGISVSEKVAYLTIKSRYPKIKEYPELSDTQYSEGNAVLIGGPAQNLVTKQVLNSGEKLDEDFLSFGRLTYVNTESAKFLILSDEAGFKNAPMMGYADSPLVNFIPVEYVPIAAAATGFTMLWLWYFFKGLFLKIAKIKVIHTVLDKFKKKEIKQDYLGFQLLGLRLKFREWLAILIAALIFAIAVSFNTDFLKYVFVFIGVNVLIYILRNLIRLIMDHKYDAHSEYHFWIWGALITLITGWFGNTFGLAGCVTTERKAGIKATYIVNWLTFFFGIVFLLINMVFPNVLFQLAHIFLLSISFISLLPIKPMNGQKIWQWSKLNWALSFIPIGIVYIVANFI